MAFGPLRVVLSGGSVDPAGPLQVRRLSDLDGLFAGGVPDDRLVYEVARSPVPEEVGEVPHSITTIYPGDVAGEFHMTKGHIHPNPQGEIYLGLQGSGGLLLFDGSRAEFIEMGPDVIGYIPPGSGC